MTHLRVKSNGQLLFGSYVVAFLLVSIPLTEFLTSIWPLELSNPSWRFGAIGVFSRALMTPLLGLVLAIGLATFQSHREFLRVLGAMSGLAGFFLIGVLLVFVLDGSMMRGLVTPEAEQAFVVASVFATVKFVLAALATLVLGWGAWRLPLHQRARGAHSAG